MSFIRSRPRRRPGSSARAALLLVGLAAGLRPAPAAGQASIISDDGLIKVVIKPVAPVPVSAFDQNLLAATFPGWTAKAGTGAGRVLARPAPGMYNAGVSFKTDANNVKYTTGGGAQMMTSYRATDTGLYNQLQWVQVVSVNGFGPDYAAPHIDPLQSDSRVPNRDNLPFYYTASEAPATRSQDGREIGFYDTPRAPVDGLATGSVSWTANLFAVDWDGATGLTVQDAFSWGYDMTLATDGRGRATFNSPVPAGSPAVYTGIGTNAVTWGTGSGTPPSGLNFVGSNFTPVVGERFEIGRLSFYNGTILGGTGLDALEFNADVAFGFGNTAGTPIPIRAQLQMINTPNEGVSDSADADIVRFTSGFGIEDFHVPEGQSSSVSLFARILPGGGVVAAKQLTEPILPSYRIEFAGFGTPTGGGFVTSTVPEPTTLALVAPAGLLAGYVARRRRRAADRNRHQSCSRLS